MSYNNLFHGDIDTPNHSQWRIKTESLLADRDVFHETATKKFPLGAISEARDGRLWRYIENGAAICYKAAMCQSSVPVANWTQQVQTDGASFAAVGDKIVNVNMDTTASVHDFIDGWLVLQDADPAAGLGDMYLIKDNLVGVAGTSGYDVSIKIADSGGIRTAFVAASELTVIKSKYKDVVIVPAAAATAPAVGVPLIDISANYFGWVQSRGPCPVIVDTETVVVGDQIGETDDANTDGGAGIHAVTYPIWGTVMVKGTNGQADEPAIVDLCIE